MTLQVVDAAAARAAVAGCWLEGADESQAQLGAIALQPHQQVAVHEIRTLLTEFGGALLADEVGLGKTFVALALASEARRPLVVAPMSLRGMWLQAAVRAGVRITMWSAEALSRGETAPRVEGGWDLIIVDEAHHFRNAATRRYRALARLSAGVRILLLSATPIHNRADDLIAILELFLGARTRALTDDERARYVVRRKPSMVASPDTSGPVGSHIPAVEGPHRVTLRDDHDTLDALLALPDAVPPRDGGNAGALVSFALVRQWASSTGALRGALRRRLARATAMTSALEAGRHPSYRDLRAWCLGEGAVQLAFPELLVPPSADAAALLESVRAHEAAVRTLLTRLNAMPDPDTERADHIRRVMRAHRGIKVVAFSAFEDTVRALYRYLAPYERVCVLSAGGAVIANGRLSRAAVMTQFAPAASAIESSATPAAERIELLLTTDLLSEGVNLQEAAVVIHLDMPWTPARLAQRVGRVARLGSVHRRVHVYAFGPPASADTMLGVERCLRAKLDAAGRAIGVTGSILPGAVSPGDPAGICGTPSLPEHIAAARAAVRRWRLERGDSFIDLREPAGVICAAVRSDSPGWLAACVRDGRPILLTSASDAVTDSPEAVARAVSLAEGHPVPIDESACRAAILAISEWSGRQRAADDAELLIAGTSDRRRVLARIATIARQAPPHLRPRLSALIRRARHAAITRCGAGAEWVLGELADGQMADRAWLLAVAAFGESYGPRDANDGTTGIVVTALILLQRDSIARDGVRVSL
jgi:superfamily II DNA or RNA helicase